MNTRSSDVLVAGQGPENAILVPDDDAYIAVKPEARSRKRRPAFGDLSNRPTTRARVEAEAIPARMTRSRSSLGRDTAATTAAAPQSAPTDDMPVLILEDGEGDRSDSAQSGTYASIAVPSTSSVASTESSEEQDAPAPYIVSRSTVLPAQSATTSMAPPVAAASSAPVAAVAAGRARTRSDTSTSLVPAPTASARAGFSSSASSSSSASASSAAAAAAAAAATTTAVVAAIATVVAVRSEGAEQRPRAATPIPTSPESDIDSSALSQRYEAQYAPEIYEWLSELEKKNRPKLRFLEDLQTDINAQMRAILVDWLVEVAQEYRLSSQTLYLAVNYIDRVLSKSVVTRSRLQLLGCACMLLAAKYEEIYPPQVEEFVYISDHTYTREEMLLMTSHVLTKLKFNLTVATPRVFLVRYLRSSHADELEAFLSKFLLELTLQEYTFIKWEPSRAAASAVLIARLMLNRRVAWTDNLRYYSNYAMTDLHDCARELLEVHRRAQTSDLKAVREKYAHSSLHTVSHLPCLDRLPF